MSDKLDVGSYPKTCRCEICDKDIELKDAYTPTRYGIGVLPNNQIGMLSKCAMYKFVCEECGEEIKRKIAEIKDAKSTKTQLNRLLFQKSFEDEYLKPESHDCW